jgi:hypothetical protein
MSEHWRPASFSLDQIAQSGGAIRQGYMDGRPFAPVNDDAVSSPALERLAERVRADLLNEDIAWLRERGAHDLAQMIYEAGGARPTLRWTREQQRRCKAETQKNRRAESPEKVKQWRADTQPQWRAANRDKVREYKRKERDANYFARLSQSTAKAASIPAKTISFR